MTTQRQRIRNALTTTDLNVLSLVEYGSRAYGAATADSDRDLLGIYVESDPQIYGLGKAESLVYRLHPNGRLEQLGLSPEASGSAVVEMVFHPLRKFVKLAATGTPNVLSSLWAPLGNRKSLPRLDAVFTPAAQILVDHRDAFLTKHVGFRHAGYARAQRDALLGISNNRTHRPELIQRHGYDTKYASHMIRLLLSGLDLVRERTFHLPMQPSQLELLHDIRSGLVPESDVVQLSIRLEEELMVKTTLSNLPEYTDPVLVDSLLKQIRNTHLHR